MSWQGISSEPLPAEFLHHPDHRIQRHRHEAEQHDRHKQPVHLENLAAVDNQISQPVSRCQKFSDYHAHQAQPDVDLHVADDRGDGTRQHDFEQRMAAAAVERVDQFDFLLINGGKTGVKDS